MLWYLPHDQQTAGCKNHTTMTGAASIFPPYTREEIVGSMHQQEVHVAAVM
jgi:hypothetical protein